MSEDMYAIAKIMNGKAFDNIYGYRIAVVDIRVKKSKIIDVSIAKLSDLLDTDEIKVSNLAHEGNRIVGTQGDLDSLPSIDRHGNFLSDNNATILYKVRDRGFVLIDWKGNVSYFDLQKMLYILNEKVISGLTNGKIVYRNGLHFISAIRGSFVEVV